MEAQGPGVGGRGCCALSVVRRETECELLAGLLGVVLTAHPTLLAALELKVWTLLLFKEKHEGAWAGEAARPGRVSPAVLGLEGHQPI